MSHHFTKAKFFRLKPDTMSVLLMILVRTIFFAAFFLLFIYLNYHQVFNDDFIFNPDYLMLYGYPSDTGEHIDFLKQYFNGEIFMPHPLWHLGVKGLSIMLHSSIEDAAVIFSVLMLMLWTFAVFYMVEKMVTSMEVASFQREVIQIVVTICILFIGPLWIPFYSGAIFDGQGSPNIWHNVTLWTVKPLALIAMLATLKALLENSTKYYFIAALTTLISLFAKPNFVIVFLPALFTLLLYRKYFTKRALYFFATTAILSTFILLYQFLNTFNDGSRVIINFLAVWSFSSQNIPVSIFLALAFPIIFALSQSRKKMNDALLLSWYMTGFGIILFALFAETGERFLHGNFGWSYMISMSLLYLFSILEFFKEIKTMHIYKKVVLSLLLLSQSAVGIYYFIKIVIGYSPIYITF